MIRAKQHVLVYDLSNVAYMGAYLAGRHVEQAPDAVKRIYDATLYLMRKLYKHIQPTQVFFACDHHIYWRREIFPGYKGHRQDNPLKQQVRLAIELLKSEKQKHCLEVPRCEADDVIYALSTQVTRQEGDEISIVSSDSDFIQLESAYVHRVHPKTLERLPKVKDPGYELFLKCIRGDISDNIPAAYPFVKADRVETAYRNPNFRQQLMESVNRHGQRVADCYAFNRRLIDLSQIPLEVLEPLNDLILQRLHALALTEG